MCHSQTAKHSTNRQIVGEDVIVPDVIKYVEFDLIEEVELIVAHRQHSRRAGGVVTVVQQILPVVKATTKQYNQFQTKFLNGFSLVPNNYVT